MIPKCFVILVFAAAATVPQVAAAQLYKTFVSQSGNDNNNCAFTTPCHTIPFAVNNTQPGGLVVCLDRADYSIAGAANITVSLTIDCGSTDATMPPIIVNAPGQTVVLKHFSSTANGTQPIVVNNGSVVVEDVHMFKNLGTAITFAPQSAATLTMSNVLMDDNNSGVTIKPASGGSVSASIVHSRIVDNSGGGVKTDSTNGAVDLSISDSVISNNGGNGVNAVAGANQNIMNIRNSIIAKNAVAGIQANGANAGVLVQTTLLDQNTSGATSVVGGGHISTYGNNSIVGSSGSGFTGSAPLQ
jgi:hypothetical protein